MKDTASPPSPDTAEVCEPPRGKKNLHILAILAAVLITLVIFLFRGSLGDLRTYGYAGVFLINLIASASLVIPVPGLAVVIAGGYFLNPFLVALIAGAAQPIGELTGYLAGYGGEVVIERTKLFHKLCGWMRRHGDIIIFVLSVIPNPLFDLAGVAAGAVGYSVWRFLLICWIGKTIKSLVFALAGHFGVPWVVQFYQQYQ